MIPVIVTTSELRKHLANFLDIATNRLVVVKSKGSNKVIIDENEFNRISSLAQQFEEEDPEGKYRPEFISEVLNTAKESNIDESVNSMKDLL